MTKAYGFALYKPFFSVLSFFVSLKQETFPIKKKRKKKVSRKILHAIRWRHFEINLLLKGFTNPLQSWRWKEVKGDERENRTKAAFYIEIPLNGVLQVFDFVKQQKSKQQKQLRHKDILFSRYFPLFCFSTQETKSSLLSS